MDIYKHRSYFEEYDPNLVYNWIPSDSEDRFKDAFKQYPKDSNLIYYLKNPIEYKLNNKGFRTPDDFNSNDNGNVFLGCSHTFGIGHHLENTWSYKLNNIVGGKFWNLSLGGTGVITAFRLLFGYHKELNIKNIFHYAPIYPRYEFIINEKPTNILLNLYEKSWEKKFGTFAKECLFDDEQINFTYNSYIHAIKGLANEIGVNYYLIDWKPNNMNLDGSLRARDLYHYSVIQQHAIYEKFLKLYDINLYEKHKKYDTIFSPNDVNVFKDFAELKTKKTLM
jgi:hypothetical protein